MTTPTTNFVPEKVKMLVRELGAQATRRISAPENIEYQPCGYKKDNNPPKEGWMSFPLNTRVGGRRDAHYWFRTSFKAPEAKENKDFYLRVRTGLEPRGLALNPQSLVYVNGKIVQGFDMNHTDLALKPGEDVELYVYFYVGMIDALVDFSLSIVETDRRIEKLYYDLKVPLDTYHCLKCDDETAISLMSVLEQAVNLLSMREPYSEEYYKSIEAAEAFLDRELYKGLCRKDAPVVNCIGHTHIDVAWLWTIAQTREKAQRSFATALELMRKYPEYIFMSSQPKLYQIIKEDAPELYAEIKKRAAEGRWEVEGGMWLEADCNLISGESMVRQFLHGKKFIKDEFGKDSRVLWLPDVFGYSAAMPQILKKCGIDYFVTSKISWNETNCLPYDTFMWQGIDGSETLTYFITSQNAVPGKPPDTRTTYCGEITPKMVKGTWDRYQQKEYNDQTLMTFGHGDGGGGPTAEMLETQRRTACGLPGLPATRIVPAIEHLENVKKNFERNSKKLRRMPGWVGELYLEYHRGTYTSMARNKKNNRQSEFLLQKAETLSVLNNLLLGAAYPQDKLHAAWETVLTQQFHDILPGSSIFEVYEDSDRYYAEVRAAGTEVASAALADIAKNVDTEGGILVYNPLGFESNATVKVDGKTIETGVIPAMGWKVINKADAKQGVKVEGNTIENRYYRLKLDKSGRIKSLYDKRFKREVFKKGEFGNEIQVFEDFPRAHDAWEITNYYKQKMWVLDGEACLEPVFDGERAGIRITRDYLSSRICQTVYLYNTLERIDFETEIDWNEEHQLVKASFPFDVNAAKATYEIQFGNIERPTHENTSWDAARFEVCGHKWADISENGYGVSLLNDCKYGHSAEGSTLKLTLLKCATYPNPHADKGHHSFTYSLLPHGGDFREAHTVREAYSLNQPLECAEVKKQSGALADSFSLVCCDAENVVVDTVKRAEAGDGIILRMYDSWNRRTKATLEFGFDIERAALCDMLENEIEDIQVDGRRISLPVGNYEIVTIKVVPDRE